jgi:hypothetical protein
LSIPSLRKRQHLTWVARTDYLRKPTIFAANRDVKDEVESLIERGIVVGTAKPRIMQKGVIFESVSKLASFPHVLLREIDAENLIESTINVGEEVVLGPFNAKYVISFREVASW